jgi:hypothetical protein
MSLARAEFLVDMAEHDRPGLLVPSQDRIQCIAVAQADPVHPGAADGKGMMVQGDQVRRGGVPRQFALQTLQLLFRDQTAGLSRYARIQQVNLPGAEFETVSQIDSVSESRAHALPAVMIARNGIGGGLKSSDHGSQPSVTLGRLVLAQVARQQQRRQLRMPVGDITAYGFESAPGFYALVVGIGIRVQMAIGQLDQLIRTVLPLLRMGFPCRLCHNVSTCFAQGLILPGMLMTF